MSAPLAYYANGIPLGYTILQVQNELVGNLTTNGWQLLAQVDEDHSDVIPPVTETIGTSKFREVVRIYFPDNVTIKIGSYQVCIADAFAQSFTLKALTAGAVAAAITINGVTVTGATGSSGSTANDNLKALFYALRDSADSTILGWDFWYNGANVLIGTCRTAAAAVTVSGAANVTYSPLGAPVLAGARSGFVNVDVNYAFPVTTDLTNGFVYYMEVWSRSFSISTKCLSGFTGRVYASYIDHADALASLPASGFCTPIELVVGSGAVTTSGNCHLTHLWTIGTAYGNKDITSSENAVNLEPYDGTPDWHPFLGMGIPDTPMDSGLAYGSYAGAAAYGDLYQTLDFCLLNAYYGNNFETAYKVLTVGLGAYAFNTPRQASVRFFPAMNLKDIYQWNGSEPNESVAMTTLVSPVGVNNVGLTLEQAIDGTSTYATVLLNGVTGLSASGGSFVIGIEEFTYTGLSGGNTATGVSRAQNGTVMARHFVNDVVEPVVWFLKINNAAICCGPNKPV